MLFTEYNEAEIMDAIARNEHRLGKAEGEAKFAKLVTIMSVQGDSANITQAATDPVFREEMYEKYNIK